MEDIEKTSLINQDPFRLFFPLGWFLGVVGTLPWIFFALGYQYYPRDFHINVMSRGFLASFVFGFLMTAIPRFTETKSANVVEIIVGLIFTLASLLVGVFGFTKFSSVLTIAQILLLALFIGRRFIHRKNNPPSSFIFVALGLMLGFFGALIDLFAAGDFLSYQGKLASFGHLVGFYGMFLALIVGVGSRLFPGILGWVEIVQSQRQTYEGQSSFLRVITTDILVCLILFLGSFLVEVFFSEQGGRILRAALVQFVAIKFWRIHLKPRNKSWMSYSLIASGWTVVLGEWANSLSTSLGVDGKHIVFIGGFALMSLLVGARVTLAHGPGLTIEKNKWPYLPVAALTILAAATRASVNLIPSLYVSHLGYAAVLWILVLVIWGLVFLPKMLRGLWNEM